MSAARGSVALPTGVLLTGLLAGLVAPGPLAPRPAFAHTELRSSTPAARAVVPAATEQVVLSFTGRVRGELSTVVLSGPDGKNAARGPLTVRGGELEQRVDAPLPAGAWRLLYRVVAADGHPLTGAVPFTVVDGAPSASTTPEVSGGALPSAAPSPDRSAPPSASAAPGSSPGPPLAVAGGLLAVGAGLLVRRRRARLRRTDASARPAEPS